MSNSNTPTDTFAKVQMGRIPGLKVSRTNLDLSGVGGRATVNLSQDFVESGNRRQSIPDGITFVSGNRFDDTVIGSNRNEIVLTGAGADRIDGRGGNDMLFGYDGNDTIVGGAGDDLIVGSAGNDMLTGGRGADNFLYTRPSQGRDVITDFDRSEGDQILIAYREFGGGLGFGDLAASQFVVGSRAGDRNDRFIYNRGSGVLFFDADGSGSRAQVAIAKLDDSPLLRASDISMVV